MLAMLAMLAELGALKGRGIAVCILLPVFSPLLNPRSRLSPR